MAERPSDAGAELAQKPEEILDEMAETRAALAEGLNTIKARMLRPLGIVTTDARRTMPTKKAAKKTTAARGGKKKAAASRKTGTKRKVGAKSAAKVKAGAKRSTAKRKAAAKRSTARAGTAAARKRATRKRKPSLATKAKKVMGEVLAGAAVGAAAGATQAIAHELQEAPPRPAESWPPPPARHEPARAHRVVQQPGGRTLTGG